MLGAVVGDIIGSVYETKECKSKEFPLFTKHSRYTDDTVLTVAVADALLNSKEYTHALQEYGRRYPKKKYGERFLKWIFSETPKPYNSWGNGSAMRVSPVGYVYDNLNETEAEASKSARVTHNHTEGIKGAQAVASAIFLARNKYSKNDIKNYISGSYGYDLDRAIDTIRPNYSFDTSCAGSVPEALIAFLESNSFEDSIRNAISLGGDSDTIACISGAIAEAYYGNIPAKILDEVKQRIPHELMDIIEGFRYKYNILN